MRKGKRKTFFSGLKVRTSLILVLVFFFGMLIAGAALGVLSLRMNNDALHDIVRDQETASSMDEAINQYQKVQVMMGRAMASFTVNGDLLNNSIADAWGGAGETGALSASSQALLRNAENQIEQSTQAFQAFKAQAEASMAPESGYERVITSYDELMSSGLSKLLEALKSSRMEEYNDVLSNLVVPMEANLLQAYQTLKTDRKSVV